MRYLKLSLSFLLLTLITVILLDWLLMPIYTRHSGEIIVPDLTGIPLRTAEDQLHQLHLLTHIRYQFDRQYPKHTVLSQSPEPGARVKKGRVIRITVSEDEHYISVPQLKLATLRDAHFILESNGLKAGKITTQHSDEYPAGIVIAQFPEAGNKIEFGATVDLTLSEGRLLTQVRVPYLIRKTITEAKMILADSTLKIGRIQKTFDPDLLPGTIVAQLPDSGMIVDPYSEIHLTISSTDATDAP